MYIESVRNSDGTPVPHLNGKLHYPLAQYLIWLRCTPMTRGGYREPTTVGNVFKHLKIWFDFCEDLKLGFDQVTYEMHLLTFKQVLGSQGVKPQSINAYYRSWRAFYEWCSQHSIPCLMTFPSKVKIASEGCSQSTILNNRTQKREGDFDPGLEVESKLLDHKEVVLNTLEFARFSELLAEVEPVFSYIGYMMVTTGLRIGGVMQIPLGSNKLNPSWLRYPELKAAEQVIQKLNYIPKGKKRILRCIIPVAALKSLHEDYVISHRKKHLKLFSKRYESEPAPLWITSTGKRVEKNDVWNAFRQASTKFGRRVTPHHMRHTYATYIVYNYFKAHGLTPNLAYAHDIHEALRVQLGHADLEVTKRYIRTVIRTYTDAWLPKLTPHIGEAVHREMPSEVLAAVINFFEPSMAQAEGNERPSG